MPWKIKWLAKPRILYADLSGSFTIWDLRQINTELEKRLNEASAPLYVTADMSNLEEYPRMVTELHRSQTYLQHPMLAGVYLYGVNSPTVDMIMRFLARLIPIHYNIVDSLEDALAEMVAQEPGLAPFVASIDRKVWE